MKVRALRAAGAVKWLAVVVWAAGAPAAAGPLSGPAPSSTAIMAQTKRRSNMVCPASLGYAADGHDSGLRYRP
jgi:hypothetical protein